MLVSRLAIVVAVASAALFACAQPAGHPRASVSDSRGVPTSALGSMTSVRVTFHHDGSTPNAAIVFLHGVGGSETTWSELRGSESVAAALRESQGPALNILVVAVAGDSLGWPEHLDGSVSWKRFQRPSCWHTCGRPLAKILHLAASPTSARFDRARWQSDNALHLAVYRSQPSSFA